MGEATIVQVTNVSPFATSEQLETLFGFFGEILNLTIYNLDNENIFKVCFVEYKKPLGASLAQHLTHTVFIDRILVVLPYDGDSIPSEQYTLSQLEPTLTEYATNFDVGVVSQVVPGPAGTQVISTTNPRLTALNLSQYPNLPINTEPVRAEEIRRTLYIGNLDSTVQPDDVMKFFNDIGEIKYIRLAGDDTLPTRFAFVEYTHQSSVANALQNTGYTLGSRSLKINHSNNAIVKPAPRIDIDDSRSSKSRARDRSNSRDRHGSSSKYDRDRSRRDKYSDRRLSPRDSRHRRSRTRDPSPYRRRSKSRERSGYRRSKSPRDKGDTHRRRSRSRSWSKERTKSRRHRSSRKRN